MWTALRPYVEWVRLRFLLMLAYRVNYYSGIAVYTINIGAYYFLWKALYQGETTLGGLTATQMTTYVAVAWMARSFYFNNVDREMAQEIREGRVAVELIRPYNYLVVKAMQALGEGLFRLCFFSVPGMVLVSFLLPVDLPESPHTWGLFALSLLLSFVINTQLNLLTGLMAFFLLNNEGLMYAKRVVVDLFSGLILPLSLFPEWARAILVLLPFQAISYLPTMIVTGAWTTAQIEQALLVQLVWSLLLVVPIRALWVLARRKLVVQGG
ncbi:MAG: ABC-2 family transporter protein [Calditerricola sp.]|jgi:ABC-type uncharacterized transport system, permease component|nr:daunorubicin ABC transporter permease [Bacillota bacterium]MCG0314321.1 ABC-2 family transporter protein [Calditerricola sp.]